MHSELFFNFKKVSMKKISLLCGQSQSLSVFVLISLSCKALNLFSLMLVCFLLLLLQ